MERKSTLLGKEGPFSEFEVIVERKNGEVVEGAAFEKDYKKVCAAMSCGSFVRFMIFKDTEFGITHIASDEIAVLYINERQKGVYLFCGHPWMEVIKEEK